MNSNEVVGSQGVSAAALRRKFLTDMAWPVSSDLLCRMFGLLNPSLEVQDAEGLESNDRMRRFTDDDLTVALVVSAAKDAVQILALVDDEDERVAWLTTYAMAVVNLLEEQGKVEIHG